MRRLKPFLTITGMLARFSCWTLSGWQQMEQSSRKSRRPGGRWQDRKPRS